MDYDEGLKIQDNSKTDLHTSFAFKNMTDLDKHYKKLSQYIVDPRIKDRSFRCPKIEESLYQNQDYTALDLKISKNLLELYSESGVTDII